VLRLEHDTPPIGGTKVPKISAVVDAATDAALKERAKQEDRSVGAIVRIAIRARDRGAEGR